MKKFGFKGAAWDSLFLAFVRVVTMLVAILQTKILSVGLSLSDYGTYSQAHIIVSIVTSLIILGLGDAINYFYNGASSTTDSSKRSRFVNTIFAIELAAGVIAGAMVLLGQNLIVGYFSNEAVRGLLWIVAVIPILNNLLILYQVLFVSTGKAKVIAIRNLVVSILKVVAFYFAVHFFKSLLAIYVSLAALEIAQLVLFQFILARAGLRINPFKASGSQVKTILKYALPMGVFALTNTLLRDIDKLVVSYMADAETLAIYTNCSKVLPFDIISSSFATVLIPYVMRYISEKSYENASALFKNYLKVGYYSVWLLGVAVLCIADTAITFLYADKYLPGKPIFICYVIDSMFRFASMHLILTADGQSKTLMWYSVASLVANAILNIVLYYLLGVIGPAVATTVVTLGYTLAVLKKSMRILGISWRDAFDLRDVLLFVAQLAVTGVIMVALDRSLLSLGLHKYVSMVISGGLFAGGNLLLLRSRIAKVTETINYLKM